jgi:hypothetical protein
MLKPTNARERLIAELAAKYHEQGMDHADCVKCLEIFLERPLTDTERIIAFVQGGYGSYPPYH